MACDQSSDLAFQASILVHVRLETALEERSVLQIIM